MLIKFQNLDQETLLKILAWRNDDTVRLYMNNSVIIDTKNHFKFIDMLIDNKEKDYRLVLKDKQEIGIIYLNDIDQVNKKAERLENGKSLRTYCKENNIDPMIQSKIEHGIILG